MSGMEHLHLGTPKVRPPTVERLRSSHGDRGGTVSPEPKDNRCPGHHLEDGKDTGSLPQGIRSGPGHPGDRDIPSLAAETAIGAGHQPLCTASAAVSFPANGIIL